MMGLTNEIVLKMLQNRNVDIKSLDREGVLAWGDQCWERYTDGGSEPSASFKLEPFGGGITYVSGTGNTIIITPGRYWGGRAECKIYSAVEEPEHVEALSAEIDPLTTEIQNAHSRLVPAGEQLELQGINVIPLKLEYAE